jgi:glutamine amidotransferase
LGNLRSVARAVARAGAEGGLPVEPEITHEPERIRAADKLVVPGQGGFGAFSRALAGDFREAVLTHIARGSPYLGICLGLQILFDSSAEAPGCPGLGVFAGEVARLQGGLDRSTGAALKIPHVGWNTVEPARESRLLPHEPTWFYFVHSYAAHPRDSSIVSGTTEHGERFVSAIERDNVFAVQFHPEKSQAAGLALLRRFLAL